jgi:hypothetical protein
MGRLKGEKSVWLKSKHDTYPCSPFHWNQPQVLPMEALLPKHLENPYSFFIFLLFSSFSALI